MEYIGKISEHPMMIVDDVTVELRHLSNLCHVMSLLQDHHDTVNTEAVGDAMCLIRDCLDTQLKALDAIQWPMGKTVTA